MVALLAANFLSIFNNFKVILKVFLHRLVDESLF
jgi:hypothetical protein